MGFLENHYKVSLYVPYSMQPAHKKILEVLRQKPATTKEIAEIIGYSPHGVRGRISELRSQYKYDIRKINKKHVLIESIQLVDKTLAFIDQEKKYGQQVNIKDLMHSLSLEREGVESILLQIYKNGQLLQMSKDTFIIYKKEAPYIARGN